MKVDPRYFKPAEVETLLGDQNWPSKLGYFEISVQEMCAEMVAKDLTYAQRTAFLKAHGHDTPVSVEEGR